MFSLQDVDCGDMKECRALDRDDFECIGKSSHVTSVFVPNNLRYLYVFSHPDIIIPKNLLIICPEPGICIDILWSTQHLDTEPERHWTC